jgi:hypothetical protein
MMDMLLFFDPHGLISLGLALIFTDTGGKWNLEGNKSEHRGSA